MLRLRSAHTRAAAAALALALLAACAPDAGAPTAPATPDTGRKPAATVPGAPGGVAATGGDARATVTWQAPASDGGSAVTSYRVVASPGGASLTVAAPATTATVTGLTNGTAYTFTVAATNRIGTGAASAPSAPVTPTAVTPPPPPPAGSAWVMGYYVGYQRGLYPETALDFARMTHVVTGRIRPRVDGTVVTDFDIDATNGPAMARTVAARAHQAGRKALLMLGGAGERDGFVGAASSANRARFVANLLATMDALGYDGIDVDWEPIAATDRPDYLALLQALRAARPAMLLTTPVGWVNTNFPGEIDAWYATVAAQVDRMNLMTYDMAGNWGGWQSWHSSALADAAPNRPSSVQSSIQRYLAVGVPAAKLGVGIGAFGSCWRGVTAPRQTVPSTVTLGASDNAMSYATILAQYFAAPARVWDAAAQVPYLTFASPRGPQGCTFVSYEDPQSVEAKTAWARSAGLGAAILWTVAEQYVPASAQPNPLLDAAMRGFGM